MYAPLLFLVIILGSYPVTPSDFSKDSQIRYFFYNCIYFLTVFDIIFILLNEFNIIL